MTKGKTFNRKRYDKWCWQVYNGDDLVGLVEAFANDTWGIYRLGGAGMVSKAKFPSVAAAFDWLNEHPDRMSDA